MTRATFWIRTAACTGWALLVLGALRSEPLWYDLVGDQYNLTNRWCGPWGCSASLPKLLAWQIPMALVTVPTAWLLVRSVPVAQRWAGMLSLVLTLGTIGWLLGWTVYTWSYDQISSVSDAARYAVFACIAGTSIAIPVLLASMTCLIARWLTRSGTDTNAGTMTEVSEDFGDVVVPHVDAAT